MPCDSLVDMSDTDLGFVQILNIKLVFFFYEIKLMFLKHYHVCSEDIIYYYIISGV